jgi:histone H3/H4
MDMETQGNVNTNTATETDAEVLVVVSKVKKFIRANSGLNTSQCAIDALSKKIAELCTQGANNARTDGRKTLMGRDIL